MKTVNLQDYLQWAGSKKFGYGEDQLDCSRFVTGWIKEVGREYPDDDYGTYKSRKDAARIIKTHGGFTQFADKVADDYYLMEVESPDSGDVGVVEFQGVKVFAINVGGGHWAVKTVKGIASAPMTHSRAWRVKGGGGVGAEIVGSTLLAAIGVETFLGFSAAASAQIVGTIVLAAASIGIQYAVSSLNKPKQDPNNQQQVVRQATGTRVRHYGMVKVGGTIAFSESVRGVWYEVVATGSGQVDAVVETWFNDKRITLNSAGINQTLPLSRLGEMYWRTGLPIETAYSNLTAAIPAWTSSHRLDGCSSYLRVLRDPGSKEFGYHYQGGIPRARQVLRGARVYDPRDGVTRYTENPVLIAIDYLTHKDGWNFPLSYIDIDACIPKINLCDELIKTKSGGFRKRYTCSGSYLFSETKKEVLRRILSTCDMQLNQQPDGRLSFSGGEYEEPIVTITDREIMASEWTFGVSSIDSVNEIRAIYTSRDHDYQPIEAPPWKDDEAITRDGLVSQTYDAAMVYDYRQAQALSRIVGRRINSKVRGELRLTVAGVGYSKDRAADSRPDL